MCFLSCANNANPEFAKPKSLTMPIIPGNCSFHTDVTIRKAGDNITNGFRRFMAHANIPDGPIFNVIQNILSDKHTHKLNIDNFLHNDKRNPLIPSKAHILS